MSDFVAHYVCPVMGCTQHFCTVKFMIDHLFLYHDGPSNSNTFTCNIHQCMVKSASVSAYRKHVRRVHLDEWCKQRYMRCSAVSMPVDSCGTDDCDDAESVVLNDVTSEVHDSDSDTARASCSGNDQNSPIDHYTQLKKKLLIAVLKHREVNFISKSAMQQIMVDMKEILRLSQVAVIHSLSHVNSSAVCVEAAEEHESILDDIFEHVLSVKHFRTYCTKYLGMVQPSEIVLDRVVRNGKCFKNSYQYVSIISTLHKFLSHDDVAAEVAQDLQCMQHDAVLSSYRDGSAFSSDVLFSENDRVLRLHFYVDDFEVCNPIGSRRSVHKLVGVYFLVGNVHTRYWSQTSSIHLAILARTRLVKVHGLDKIMMPLLKDLKILETVGIKVKFCGSASTFKGTVATISADNLASHQIGGFRQTFSSGKICRNCLIDYDDISRVHSEEHCVIRTADVHQSHLRAVAIDSSFTRTYGVKGRCLFDELEHFSVTESLPPDVMHDILEGLLPINILIVLRSLIQGKNLTVKVFNERLDLFSYGTSDLRTKPPHLADDFASNSKISGSASQNWTLFWNLPFLIGDLIKKNVDSTFPPFWALHLLARQICRIVFAPVIKRNWLLDLQRHIAEHHTILAEIDHEMFTPKLHFLVHYPRLIEVFGPLKHLWCMRFEACHQYYKQLARITKNFRNIALTLSERHQYKACWQLSCDNALSADVSITGKQVTVSVAALPSPLQVVLSDTFSVGNTDAVLSVNCVKLQCALLIVNELYVIDTTSEEEVPIFICITHVLEHEGTWILCGLLTVALEYDSLTDSYIVQKLDQFITVSVNELKTHKPVAQIHTNGKIHAYLHFNVV